MTKKLEKNESFVTQSHWVEGMEMIKDFFGQLFSQQQETNQNLEEIRSEQQETNQRLERFQQEQREENKAMQENIELNTKSLGALTQEIHKARNIEFEVFKQGQRIEKLEKAR